MGVWKWGECNEVGGGGASIGFRYLWTLGVGMGFPYGVGVR